MFRLAEWGDLSYYMLEEKSASEHIILVRHVTGRTSRFRLENAQKLPSLDLNDRLSLEAEIKAKRFIQNSREDFLDYWKEFQ